ncbi:MAG: ABC transporter permease [Actinomycetota bacterium]|nr:ABC transporter permease [Actinomycetota bacterium]
MSALDPDLIGPGAGGAPPTLVAPASEARTARNERLRLLLRTPTVLVGVFVLLFWVTFAILGDRITPHDPIFDQSQDVLVGPSSEHWFGTDTLGRDVFSRVLAGSRDILLVAPAATLLGTVLGTAIGLVIGYFRRRVDDVVSRIIDAILVLPVILTGVVVITALGSRSPLIVTILIGIVFAPLVARTVRAAVLAESELDYVQAARLRGERAPYVMFKEILPNVMPPIVVEFTVRLGYAIFAVAGLTFIGLGIQPPSPDWAVQVFEYYSFVDPYWWATVFPALAIASLVIAVNLVADGVREVYER